MPYFSNAGSGEANLDFSWFNQDGTPTLYLSQANAVSAALENNTGSPVMFTTGGTSSLALSFAGLLTADQVSNVQCTLDGWSTSANGTTLLFTPTGTQSIAPGSGLVMPLTSITASGSAGIFNIMLAVTDATNTVTNCAVAISLLNAPQPNLPTLPLSVSFASNVVFVEDGQVNTLTLTLMNTSGNPITVSGGSPQFYLAFPEGQGPGDFASQQSLIGIGSNLLQYPAAPAQPWTITRETSGVVPYWLLAPGGDTLFGTGDEGIVVAQWTGIAIDSLEGTTYAVVSYHDVSGYSDSSIVLPITKVSPVQITSFTATPSSVSVLSLPKTVKLAYNVSNADYVTIVNANYGQQIAQANATGSVSFTFQGPPTTYTLIASSYATAQTQAASTTVGVTTNPYDAMPKLGIIMWSGLLATIPQGWHICDGTTFNDCKTPDLTAQFIMGANPLLDQTPTVSGAVGTYAGPDAHTHDFSVATSFSTSATEGTHTHSFALSSTATTFSSGTTPTPNWVKQTTVSTAATQGAHTHTIDVTYSGSTSDQNASSLMRPAWFALYYIMKCY